MPNVPIDVYQISLRVGNTLSVSLWNQSHFQSVLQVANNIWRQANISFDIRSYAPREVTLLNANSNANLSSDADKMYLLANHPGRNGVGICLVNIAFSSSGDLLGGYYEPRFRSCFVCYLSLANQAGINLAHELGHALLGHGHGGGSHNLMQTHTPSTTNVRLIQGQIDMALRNVASLTS